MSSRRANICLLILMLLIYVEAVMGLAAMCINRNVHAAKSEDVSVDSICFVTAAHLPTSNFPNATCVWSDTNTDRAVYVKNDYTPTTEVTVGSRVTFGEYKGTIASYDDQGIVIKLEGSLAKHGMSGTPVYYNDTPVAFISKALDVDIVYAVFF